MAQMRQASPSKRKMPATLRARILEAKPKRVRKTRPVATPSGAPLSDDEAELFARLAPLLAKRPRRKKPRARSAIAVDAIRLEDSELTQRLARALYEPVSDRCELVAPPPLLPDVSGDEPSELSALPQAAVWVQRSRRMRLRTALRTSAAWLTTVVIVALIVGGTSVALIGLEKSRHLLGLAHAQTQASLGLVSARLLQLVR